MWQIVYEYKDKTYHREFDTEKQTRKEYQFLANWGDIKNVKVYHKTTPTRPSMVPLPSYSGYRKNIFEGWRIIESSTIKREEYTVEFIRHSSKTIDDMCDALNGWYNVWDDYEIVFTDKIGKILYPTSKNDTADMIFEMVMQRTHRDPKDEGTEAEDVRTMFQNIVRFER